MTEAELAGVLDFLRQAEGLKTTRRSGYTSAGEPETVAEHTWRLCLMALVLQPEIPDVDFVRLVKICLVHDLGEVIGGDVPAPEQAALTEDRAARERRDLLSLLTPLPRDTREHITELWDDYESGGSAEARLAKALDKLETILQHAQGRNPPDFDYRFNLDYGREHTDGPELIVRLRRLLDEMTEERAREVEARSGDA